MLEPFLHALIQILNVPVGAVGERVARGASSNQLLGLGIEEIDDHGAHLISFCVVLGSQKPLLQSRLQPQPPPNPS